MDTEDMIQGLQQASWQKVDLSSFCHLAIFCSQPSRCKLIFPASVSLCKLHLKCLALAVPKFSLLMLIWITLQFHNEEENFSDWAWTERVKTLATLICRNQFLTRRTSSSLNKIVGVLQILGHFGVVEA
jgi:hypothetical protein